jgi:hypothetical protein
MARVAGLLIAILGVLLGLVLTIPSLILTLAYWNAAETGGNEGRAILVTMILLGAGIGYGIYRLGRWIAK